MTHSGGNPHNVGDKGQRFEVTFLHGDQRRVFGWSDTLEGAMVMVESVKAHPDWTAPEVRDRDMVS